MANLKPVFTWQPSRVQGGGVEFAFSVRTSGSDLYQVEYSLDGIAWSLVFPEDGIADEKEESFTFRIDGLKPGEYNLQVRAADTVGNVGTSSQKFRAE